jgi:hypothetical protein
VLNEVNELAGRQLVALLALGQAGVELAVRVVDGLLEQAVL